MLCAEKTSLVIAGPVYELGGGVAGAVGDVGGGDCCPGVDGFG